MPTKRRRVTRSAPSMKDYEDDYEETDEEEEFEEEKPSRSRRRSSSEEEERPARRRRRARDEEDDDEEEDDEEEEEERPRRGRRARDDDDKKPKGSKTKGAKGGWSRFKKEKEEQSEWAKELKLDEEPQVIKFLDDEPFTVYRQHWIDAITSGKRSFYCLASEDLDCPLCGIGDSPRVFSAFNVLLLDGDSDPQLSVFTAAVRLTGMLESKGKGRSGPLTKGYWAVSRTGTGNKTSYSVDPIKERDLEEDWDVVPLEDDEVEEFEADLYTPETYPEGRLGAKELKRIAAELVDD